MSVEIQYRVTIVSPVYDDAEAASRLVEELSRVFDGTDFVLRVLFVDDGSPVPLAGQFGQYLLARTIPVGVLRLRRNMGHQRAIALGVAYAQEHIPCDALLVMDADGEDRPEEALRLLTHCRQQIGCNIIFAERTRRSESHLFQCFYHIYRGIHWVLTGISVRVGNFSVVPAVYLPALVTLPALWNHYAAAIFQARLPRESLPSTRGVRYKGDSKMQFVSLVMHGLQAISVFSDIVAVRLLIVACLAVCGCAGLLVVTLALLFQTSAVVTPWLPLASAGLLVFSSALALGCFTFALGFLAQRNSLDFIPVRDYRYFVEAVQTIVPAS